MGAKTFFKVIDATDHPAVENEWREYCREDMARRRVIALQMLKTEGIVASDDDEGNEETETAVFEYLISL
jgi:hypothetical protein